MANRIQFNSSMFNAEGSIFVADLSESVASSDTENFSFNKLLVDSVTPVDVSQMAITHVISDSVFFSDGITLFTYAHKVLPETVRMTAWLTVEKDRRNYNPSSWTGV